MDINRADHCAMWWQPQEHPTMRASYGALFPNLTSTTENGWYQTQLGVIQAHWKPILICFLSVGALLAQDNPSCYGTCRFWRQGWNEPVCMWKPGKISILKAIWKNVWTFVKKSHFQKKNTTHQNPKNKTQKATRHEVSIIKPQKEEVGQTLCMTNVWKIWAVPVKFPILERKQELRKK